MAASVGVSLFGQVWSGTSSRIAFNLRGGTARLPIAMAEQLGQAALAGSAATSVEPADDGVLVTYRSDRGTARVTARQVVIATPAPVARQIVQPLSADAESFLGSVSYGPFLSMAVLTSEPGEAPWDDVYALMTPDRAFDMFFNHASCLRRGVRRPGGSLMVYVGGPPARRMLERTDDEVRELYLRDLYRVYPTLQGQVTETLIQRWDRGNTFRRPGMRPPSGNSMTEGRLHFAGDYFSELGTMEGAAQSGRAAARAALSALGAGHLPNGAGASLRVASADECRCSGCEITSGG